MLGQTPRLFPLIALVATLFIAGVCVTAPPTTARADDCLTAPNSPTPQGSHWYYRSDRATQRKCWYVRAPGQPAQQATVAAMGPAKRLHSTPAPSGAPSPDVNAPPSPHVQTSAVKPAPAPVRGGTADKTIHQRAQEEKNTVSTPEVPAPQTSTSSDTSPQATAPPAVTWPDPAVAFAAVKAQEPIEVPTDARADSVSNDAERTAQRAEPTNSVRMPMIISPVLVLAFALVGVGVLSRVVKKNAAARRARIITDHPEPDTVVDDQRQHVGRDDQYPRGGQELHSLVLSVSDPDPLQNDKGALQITQEKSERRDKLVQFCRDIEGMLQLPASPHEEPLRAPIAA